MNVDLTLCFLVKEDLEKRQELTRKIHGYGRTTVRKVYVEAKKAGSFILLRKKTINKKPKNNCTKFLH